MSTTTTKNIRIGGKRKHSTGTNDFYDVLLSHRTRTSLPAVVVFGRGTPFGAAAWFTLLRASSPVEHNTATTFLIDFRLI